MDGSKPPTHALSLVSPQAFSDSRASLPSLTGTADRMARVYVFGDRLQSAHAHRSYWGSSERGEERECPWGGPVAFFLVAGACARALLSAFLGNRTVLGGGWALSFKKKK
eukprot:RCo040773